MELQTIHHWKSDQLKGLKTDLSMHSDNVYFESGRMQPAQYHYRGAWGQGTDFTVYKLRAAFPILLCSDIMKNTLTPK